MALTATNAYAAVAHSDHKSAGEIANSGSQPANTEGFFLGFAFGGQGYDFDLTKELDDDPHSVSMRCGVFAYRQASNERRDLMS